MLRITTTHDADGPVLKLEGKWLAPWTEEVRSACDKLTENTTRPRLDLKDVSYIDSSGVQLLKSLQRAGYLLSCSQFVAAVLPNGGYSMNSLIAKTAAGRESTLHGTSTDTSETELLEQLRSGDSAAFEQLVQLHGARMLATARRFFHNEEDTADAVQDAFISAYKGIKTFKADSLLGTWLHRIVVNSCLMRRRSRDRRPTVPIEDLLHQFDETGHHCAPVRVFRDTPPDKLVAKELRQTGSRLHRSASRILPRSANPS